MSTRNRFLLLGTLFLPLGLTACGDAPSDVVETFSTSVAKGDMDTALPLMSTQVRGMFGDQKLRMALSQGAEQTRNYGGLEDIDILSEEISENEMTAKVKAESTYGNGSKQTADFDLIKENDEWKIHVDAGAK